MYLKGPNTVSFFLSYSYVLYTLILSNISVQILTVSDVIFDAATFRNLYSLFNGPVVMTDDAHFLKQENLGRGVFILFLTNKYAQKDSVNKWYWQLFIYPVSLLLVVTLGHLIWFYVIALFSKRLVVLYFSLGFFNLSF